MFKVRKREDWEGIPRVKPCCCVYECGGVDNSAWWQDPSFAAAYIGKAWATEHPHAVGAPGYLLSGVAGCLVLEGMDVKKSLPCCMMRTIASG